MTTSVYIVLEPIEIIATDVALCISDYDPAATVLVAQSVDHVMAFLGIHASVSIAFLHTDPDGFASSPLAHALDAQGARCVFMGDRAERSPLDIWVLERPFSGDTIAATIERVMMTGTLSDEPARRTC